MPAHEVTGNHPSGWAARHKTSGASKHELGSTSAISHRILQNPKFGLNQQRSQLNVAKSRGTWANVLPAHTYGAQTVRLCSLSMAMTILDWIFCLA
jgi:hypothetical protein